MTLRPIRSEALSSLSHGFFTREGGVSTGIYAGLNAGQGSKDDRDAVTTNRARVAEALGGPELHFVHQIHSAEVITRTQPAPDDKPKADAMVTDQPGLALCVLSADCAPVLFADKDAGVVGAAHAGWRGAIDGVLQVTIAAMEALGATRERISAVVGPTISQRAYEVGPEFVERFLDEDPEYARFFAGGQGDRAQFDLPGFCLAALRAAGVGQAEWTGHCTYSDEDRFFSFRRATHRGEEDYGRLVAAIVLPHSPNSVQDN